MENKGKKDNLDSQNLGTGILITATFIMTSYIIASLKYDYIGAPKMNISKLILLFGVLIVGAIIITANFRKNKEISDIEPKELGKSVMLTTILVYTIFHIIQIIELSLIGVRFTLKMILAIFTTAKPIMNLNMLIIFIGGLLIYVYGKKKE